MREIDSLTERFVAAHRPRLVSLAARIVGDDAEDVVQEALIRLDSDPVRDRPAVEVTAWLRRVCLNLAFNRRRDNDRWRRRAFRTQVDDRHPPFDDPESAALQREEQERVRSALDLLSEKHRSVLLLRYSGHSYLEISQTLEMPASSVGTTLARAERAFRETYEEIRDEHVS